MADCCGERGDRPSGRPLVAVVGNPNVGKSTLFNALTGADRAVGNWAGRTVDRAAAPCVLPGVEADLVDLPGTYSLRGRSPEERVTRDAVVRRDRADAPSAVLLVLDAANLERTLLLAAEVLDTGLPVVAAVTMLDTAVDRGITLDLHTLERALGVPVVAVRARSGEVGALAEPLRRLVPGRVAA